MSHLLKKALILAAGRGDRMMPLTADKPKCLVELNGKPLLQYSLEALADNGITEITLVIGYLGESIKAFTRRYFPQLRFEFVVNVDWQNSNSLSSLSLGLATLTTFEPYLILEADIVYDKLLLKKLQRAGADIATLLHPYESHLTGTFALVEQGRVMQWMHERQRNPRFPLETSYKTVNITRVSCNDAHQKIIRAARDTLTKYGQQAPLEYAMQALIERDISIAAIETDGLAWAELDTPQELRAYAEELECV